MKPIGFTLAEVLIAITLLGIVAAFSIHTILQQNTVAARTLMLKETIGSLYQIIEQGRQSGELNDYNFGDYLYTRLNALQQCPVDGVAQGCWQGSGLYGSLPQWDVNERTIVLPNKVTINGLNQIPVNAGLQDNRHQNGIAIDWNGLEGPNLIGEDQLHLIICFGPGPCSIDFSPAIPAGSMRPVRMSECQNLGCSSATVEANQTLFDSLN